MGNSGLSGTEDPHGSPESTVFAQLWLVRCSFRMRFCHVYLNSVQQMVSGELAGECLQTGFERHGLPPQRAPLDTVYPLREHLNSVHRMTGLLRIL